MAAESLLFTIAEKVLAQIASGLVQELALACGLKAELKKLQNTLSHVKAVILDAEEQQFTSRKVCTWLAQLKDLLFDAEDLFDEFSYEALRKKIVNSRSHGGISKKVRRFLSTSSNPIAFRLKMSRKVKEIREAFDEVAANKAKFHLNTQHIVPKNSALFDTQRELTHSFLNPSQIIGRDSNRDVILHSLMDSQSPNESVSVVSIIGFGGLGKTALAKLLFNDERVVDRFKNNKFWVCLGDLEEFDVNQVMAKIVKSITGEKSVDLDPEQLQKRLRDHLCQKRFLLVLDDVWEASRSNWLKIKELLICGDKGSKVLVTTRNSIVASNVGSIAEQSLRALPHDHCVSLFKKFTFNEGENDGELMKIGDAIVDKCKGIPLAIKTLGCLLFSKRDRAAWEFVRDNEIWKLEQKKDDILPALKISYESLPFTLKQCFVSCSDFPKDHRFLSDRLIQYWEALGLIRPSGKNKRAEDIGKQYIDELCVRGFFQDFVDLKAFSTFKMHDLIHDLALSVAQNEMKNMKGDRQGKDLYKSIRHVSFSRKEGLRGEEVPRLFSEKKSSSSCVMPTIWSVFFDRIGGEGGGIGEIIDTCISNLKHLRILDLRHITTLERLQDSIGALKHLRALNLGGCRRLKKLPDSVCKLYNLQSLSLYGCEEFEELPKDIGDLVNLKRLEITTKQKRLCKGIESLSALVFLRLIDCENLEYIFELGTQQVLLKSIQTLMIQRCKSLKCLFPSSPSIKELRELSDLETLMITDCPNANLTSIFNDQMRLVKLRTLYLSTLPQMESLPQWINLNGCATTLELLEIGGCPNLTSLPEWLHNLTSLRLLVIKNCPKLTCLPDGLVVLKELRISGCPELSRRCKRRTGEDWPNIKHIREIKLDGKRQTKPI